MGCVKLCNRLRHGGGIFWQTYPFAVKKMNQNSANGGLSGRPLWNDYFAAAKDGFPPRSKLRVKVLSPRMAFAGRSGSGGHVELAAGKMFQTSPSVIPAQIEFIQGGKPRRRSRSLS